MQSPLASVGRQQCHCPQGATRRPDYRYASRARCPSRARHCGWIAEHRKRRCFPGGSHGHKNLQATRGFTDGDAKTLGVYVTPETFDPNTYQPTLEATSRHNYVELMAKKLGADSLNLYWRPAGTATWTILSPKRTRFPFRMIRPRLLDRQCKLANIWRWASLPTMKLATRAMLRAQCFSYKPWQMCNRHLARNFKPTVADKR